MADPGSALAGLGESVASPDLLAGVEALGENDPGYSKAHAYYTGDVGEVFASAKLRRAMRTSGMAFRFNFAQIPVNARSERIQISAVTAEPESANEVLQELWTQLRMSLYGRQYQCRALELGDAYVMVWPTPEAEATPPTDLSSTGPAGVSTRIRDQLDVCYNSPRSVRIFYDPERPLRKRYAIKQWLLPDGTTRADLYYADHIECYRKVGKGRQARWVRHVETMDEDGQGVWPLPNPFGEVPFFHFRTDAPYGIPVHKGFYGPQDAIHKLIISHMAGVDYQTFPQRYALVHPDSDTSEPAAADEDEFAFGDDGGATRPDTEGRSQLTADPGSVWWLTGVSGVGEFQPAQPAIFTDPMLTYLRFGAQISNTPLHRIDPTGEAPSGESLRTAEAPFVKSCTDLMESFEDTWVELLEFALKVLGVSVESVDVQWNPAQSADDIEGWATLKAKLEAGLPVRQAFLEAGYSIDQVDTWFPEDAEDDDIGRAVELLGQIGAALASLGTALSLGALSPEQMHALIADVIPTGDLFATKSQAETMAALVGAGVTPESAADATGLDDLELKDEPEPDPAVAAMAAAPLPPAMRANQMPPGRPVPPAPVKPEQPPPAAPPA
jgi:hypothetical protein